MISVLHHLWCSATCPIVRAMLGHTNGQYYCETYTSITPSQQVDH